MSDTLNQKVKDLLPAMIRCRRDLHKYAESGWTEFRTASLVAARLKELGYSLTTGAAAVKKESMMGAPAPNVLKAHQERAVSQGADPALVAGMEGGLTGLWADLPCGGPGPRFALRFDMDANDAVETDAPGHVPNKGGFASINKGVMHACAHDGHVAIGLAVAELLAELKDSLKGSIRLIFQPAEEGVRGAAPMVDAGCVREVDFILGVHMGVKADKKGLLICGARKFLATSKWDVRIQGKSSHAGSDPHMGRNALLAACAAALNLHAISRHGEGPTRITVGKLEAGQGRNVIPPNAFMALETRGATTELNDYMTSEAARIIKAAAEMWGCTYAVSTVGGTKSGESSEAMVDEICSLARAMPAFSDVRGIEDFTGSEDFAHMMTEVQRQGGLGTYIQVGTILKAGHHNDHFDFDEDDLAPAAELLVRVVRHYLGGKK
ncbi:MAG: amidohydrolase [Deltaproteobacteria bacterium]|jgi:aminobenzoyl-glutamate utilization protein A|nr:amidohydrolase [Deltaproteobacteria bacterium]